MKILLFGITKDIVGENSISFDDEKVKPENISELKNILFSKFPDLKKITSMAIAVNESYANNSTVINESDQIALIPPVSGG